MNPAQALSEKRRALLEAMLRAEGLTTTARIARQHDRSNLPLSFAQARLWFLEQLEPGNPLYNIPQAWRLSGALNVEALRRALETLTARHETLRARFAKAAGEPVQTIAPPGAVDLPLLDLSGLPEAEREAEALRLVAAEADAPFDLMRGPLVRARLLRLSAEEHVLSLTLHHIISDGWSIGVLWRELTAAYEAYAAGRTPALPELPIQYADYAVWQREQLQGAELTRQLNYWCAQLAGAPLLLDLLTDHPRPPVQTFRGGHCVIVLPETVRAGLQELSQQQGATLFMTLLAAFQTLLLRYTGQDDLLIGTPSAGRNREETENLIGFFVNTLVLRGDLRGDPTFIELLARVKETTLGAYEHQELPFEKLVEELQPERQRARTPLFQVLFALQNIPRHEQRLTGLQLQGVARPATTAKFELSLFASERAEGLRLEAEYNADLFEAATVARLLKHFQTLLTGLLADPAQRLSALPLLTETERRQVLIEWNATQKPYPRDCSLQELFEAQVQRAPEAVALSFAGRQMTYAELNRRSNQLAHYLRRLGVGPEVKVGVCLERSPELIVALLGISKAGGAYVPLDPEYPRERLDFMLADAQIKVLLTNVHGPHAADKGMKTKEYLQENKQNIPLSSFLCRQRADWRVIDLAAEWKQLAQESADNPPRQATAENLAYVIYTSGSTGRPKGVCVPQRGVVRLVKGADYAALTAEEVFLQFAPVSFDASTLEIWGALLNGARLVIFPPGKAGLAELVQVIEEQQVTTLWLTAGLFQQLVEHYPERLAQLRSLRQLLAGGDVLSVAHVKAARALAPHCRLINGYGPTENTTFTCCYEIPAELNGAASVPIGRPIANTQVYLLDRHLQPVPIGVPGELYAGGDGLARGYLNQAELTAAKFIHRQKNEDKGISSEIKPGIYSAHSSYSSAFIPLSDEWGRLYRTGDLARWLPDGNLEFLGRVDQQVKIRGFRIELGEIETVLGAHPAVRENVVVVREDAPGDKRLAAYLTVKPGQVASSEELRRYLRAKLPEYMLPAFFVVLDELPLNPNGKVERGRLPAPAEQLREQTEAGYRAPCDEVELQLAQLWEKVLGVHRVGVNDNFFELGGHSLLAVRLFAQIEKSFGKTLPLATLFEAPTVAQLAEILRAEGWRPAWTALVPINPGGSRPPFFCLHAGGGHVLFYRALAQRLGPEQPFYGVQAKAPAGRNCFNRVEDMAAYYLTEIRSLQPKGPYYLGGASFGGLVALEIAQQLRQQGEEIGLLTMFDTYGPGYPQYLPGMTKLRYKTVFWRQRLAHHWGSLRMLAGVERLGYLQEKSDKAARVLRLTVHNGVKRLGRKLSHFIGRPLPREIRATQSNILQALDSYIPQSYPGQVTLFRASIQPPGIHPDPTLGWGKVVAGSLEMIEIPGIHGAMVAEPRVRLLAEHLQECLARARASLVG